MKETIKVNLNGQLFDLDKDAYERLQKYLHSLEKKFNKTPNEAKEIIEDIEARIAELLTQKLDTTKQVVSLADVLEIISNLGSAEDMDSPVDEPSDKDRVEDEEPQTRKRIYRDVDNSVLGGVGSGLGAYFNIDPLWIRLIFVALVFLHLSGVILYIIFWVVMPPARTTAQKLEMQGKPVNIDNIQESVKQEYNRVKSGFKNIPRSQEFRNVESTLLQVVRAIGEIFLVLVKVLGAIIGLALVIALISIIVVFFIGGLSLSSIGIFDGLNWPNLLSWQHITLVGLCLFFVLVIPILAILGKIVRWIFDIPRRSGIIAGIGATIWVIALISLIVLLVVGGNKGFFRYTAKTTHELNIKVPKTLYIDVNTVETYTSDFEHFQFFDHSFVWDERKDALLNEAQIEIETSGTTPGKLEIQQQYFKIKMDYESKFSRPVVSYSWHLNDSLLVLDKYYQCDEDEVWRCPTVKLEIMIPEGTIIQYSDEAAQLITGGVFTNDFEIKPAANKKLVMTAEGLEIAK